jgi:hypothetical protein
MGALTELLDLVSLGKSTKNQLMKNPDDYKAVSSLFTKAKSISAQASKYVMEYPVAVSTTITEYDTALSIAKQVEFDCARFIILASGLNPVVRQGAGDTIEAHINKLMSSYESYSGLKVGIRPATEEDIRNGEEYMAKYYSTKEYKTMKNQSSFSREANSCAYNFVPGQEADPNAKFADYVEFINEWLYNNHHDVNGGVYPPFDQIVGLPPSSSSAKIEYDKALQYYNNKKEVIGMSAGSAAVSDITKGLGKIGPTIINLKLFIMDANGADREVTFPLAIKASLQYVDAIDIQSMLKQVQTPGKKLFEFIKLTTGQTSFFKDFIFALDSAKGDVERERTIGSTPFFRRLMSNKSKYRFKTVANVIPGLNRLVSKKQQSDLPMCTIVVDESELRPIGLRLSECLKNRAKYIDPILDTYMLLGFGIVDADNEVVHFFYAGENTNITAKISDLAGGKGSADATTAMSQALASMTKMMARH